MRYCSLTTLVGFHISVQIALLRKVAINIPAV
jgi:hypothetical protein